MCTALHIPGALPVYGRNLDLDCSYGEQVVITPRNFPFPYRKKPTQERHYALIGMALVAGNYPLYYDAANERGLYMAGLNFPGNAFYPEEAEGKDNITPFEFIPWVLGQCATVGQARELLKQMNLVNIPFGPGMPLSPLHWILADEGESIVVESVKEGLKVYDNPVGVMANNPPFDYHVMNLNNYRHLSASTPKNTFSAGLDLQVYCQGLGGLGLPGDVSSMSRFVRMAFLREHWVSGQEELSRVSQFFHLLGAVEMPRGCCRTDGGHWDITVYSSCVCNGRYYYTTYDNRQLRCVDLNREDLDGNGLKVWPLQLDQGVAYEN